MYIYNQWYHPFIISFNAWMVIAPLLLLGVSVPACLRYTLRDDEYMSRGYREPRKCVIQWITTKEWLRAYSVASGVIILLMLLLESWDGIVQAIVNFCPPIALAWVLAIIAIFVFVSLYMFMVLCFGIVIEYARYGYLIKKAELILRLYRHEKEKERAWSKNGTGQKKW